MSKAGGDLTGLSGRERRRAGRSDFDTCRDNADNFLQKTRRGLQLCHELQDASVVAMVAGCPQFDLLLNRPRRQPIFFAVVSLATH